MKKWQWLKFGLPLVLLVILGVGANAPVNQGWSIRINIPAFKLYVYRDAQLVNSYYVAVGKPSTPSPVGNFWIANKVVNPVWHPPDGRKPVQPGPRNPLGKYWLGLSRAGYGIHGNIADWSIGHPVSLGCFRMHNQDVQKLFGMIPVGTPVKVTYVTVFGNLDEHLQAWLEVYPDIYRRVNQEAAINKTLQELNWSYQPHLSALREIIVSRKLTRFEVPRIIQVEGELENKDAFWWRNKIYVLQPAKSGPESVPVTATEVKDVIFKNYINLDQMLNGQEEYQKYIWDPQQNQLSFLKLKVIIDGKQTDGLGRWSNQQVWLNLKKLAEILGATFSWDYTAVNAVCQGIEVLGEVKNEAFWVPLQNLHQIWPALKYHWSENTFTLSINVFKDNEDTLENKF